MFNYYGQQGPVKRVTLARPTWSPPYFKKESWERDILTRDWIYDVGRTLRDGVTEIYVSGRQCGVFLRQALLRHDLPLVPIYVIGDCIKLAKMIELALIYYPSSMTCHCSFCSHTCADKKAVATCLYLQGMLSHE